MKIGILCPSEIAFRRFLPALKKTNFEYAGVACADENEWFGNVPSKEIIKAEQEKASKFKSEYGGEVFESYNTLLNTDIDCVYIPLPPALHFEWAKKALEHGKNILLEKPFTTSLADTTFLINEAKSKNLAMHENYMFQYHSQIAWIQSKLPELGGLRLIRIDFGFPFRGGNDFRYNKELGGGALLDCGGYTLKLASILLGYSTKITDASLQYKTGFDVDIYGNAVLKNDTGLTCQVSFGMDNSYRCSIDIWGSEGTLTSDRILTAPVGFKPKMIIKKAEDTTEYELESDDSFLKSINYFSDCINKKDTRENNYTAIIKQAELVEQFKEINK